MITRTDNDAFEQNEAQADARAEWEQDQRINETCATASETLRPLMVARATSDALKPLLDREFAAHKDTLELMTGETWPAMLPAFLRECDRRTNVIDERELEQLIA